MLAFGDVQIYVRDFEAALRFWTRGVGLDVVEQESGENGSYARLEFPDGGPDLLLIAPPEGEGPVSSPDEPGSVSFNVTTTDFEATLARLLEYDGRQMGPTETYDNLKFVTVADPEGHTFDLVEVPEDEEED